MEAKKTSILYRTVMNAILVQVVYCVVIFIIAILIKNGYILQSTNIPDIVYKIILGLINIKFSFCLVIIIPAITFLAYSILKRNNVKLKKGKISLIEKGMLVLFSITACSKYLAYGTFLLMFNVLPHWFIFAKDPNLSIYYAALSLVVGFIFMFLYSLLLTYCLDKIKENT